MKMSHISHLLKIFVHVLMHAFHLLHHETSSIAVQPLLSPSNGIECAGWEEDEEDDDNDDDNDDFDDDDDDWYTDDDDDFDDDDEEDDEEF